MSKTFEVNVTIVPTSGDEVDKRVTVKASATVAEVAEAAGLTDIEKKNFFVDGKPANKDTRVTADSKIKFTERAQGS